jgi:hypothetical protein
MLWGVKTEVLVREIGAQSVSACVPHPTWRAPSRRLAITASQQSAGDSAFGS